MLRAALAPHDPLARRIGPNPVAEEVGSIARFTNTAFLVGHAQRQRFGQECRDLSEDLSRILFATDNADEKIVGITTVTKSAISGVHRVSRRTPDIADFVTV